jgi:uncharacterized protein (DUF433 family)
MEPVSVPTNGFEQEVSVSVNDATGFQTGGIIFGASPPMVRQYISRVQNTFQVTVPQAAASMLISVHPLMLEERIIREFEETSVVTTEHPHVVRDLRMGHREPIIAGTAVRVRILIEYWRAGTTPEELLEAFPHLTLAQVFDALSYYQDHLSEINTLIEQNRVDPALIHESARRRS